MCKSSRDFRSPERILSKTVTMADSFIWGLKNGDLEAVKKHVEDKGAAVANTEMEGGRMALHYAADYGQKEVIEYLISKGADINAADKYGMTPLLSAIFEGHTDCVQLLLKKGAKKDGKSPSGESYLDCAEKEDIKMLLK